MKVLKKLREKLRLQTGGASPEVLYYGIGFAVLCTAFFTLQECIYKENLRRQGYVEGQNPEIQEIRYHGDQGYQIRY